MKTFYLLSITEIQQQCHRSIIDFNPIYMGEMENRMSDNAENGFGVGVKTLQNLNQMQLSANLDTFFKTLYNTILKLESDEVLHQMRNDSSLYNCKMKYIQELIAEEVNTHALAQSLLLNESLQEKLRERELCIDAMKKEYAVELENIEHHCRELIVENEKKLKEKDENLLKVKSQFSALQAALTRTESNAKGLREEISKMKQENSNLKQDRNELQKLRSQLEEHINCLKKQSVQRQRYSEDSMKQYYEQKYSKTVSDYEQEILKMQKDMGLIKESWEKLCHELQNKYEEELALKAIEYEEKYKRQLMECADNLKMGSSVVFSDSEDVLNKKVELIERGYKNQISKLAEEIKQFQEQVAQVKQEMEEKEEYIAQLFANLKQKEGEFESNSKQHSNLITQKEKEIASLELEVSQLTKELKAFKGLNEQIEIQLKETKDQLKQLNKRHSSALTQSTQLQDEIDSLNKKTTHQNAKIEQYLSQLTAHKQDIIKKQHLLTANTTQIEKQKYTIDELQRTSEAQRHEIQALSLKVKRAKEQRKRIIEKMDKLHIFTRKIGRESQLLREEVVSSVQIVKNKLASHCSLLTDSLSQKLESLARKHKTQMGQLLDEMQEKQKEMIQNLESERGQMKLDIKEYEQLIKERDNDIYRLKHYVSDLEQGKKQFLIDLESQKLLSIRLEEKIQENEQTYLNSIAKVQKEISRSMGGFYSHWSDQISKVQQQLEIKDAKLRQFNEKVDQLNAQSEESKIKRSLIEDEVRKYKKKYENLKQERDEKIQSLLKKLEQEGKHRINLERELKQVRMSIMKGNYQSNNNFSFNDKERESNNKPFTTSTKEEQHRQRERELSQIREMIAKTYKVVDGPAQRDLGRNFSKKVLF